MLKGTRLRLAAALLAVAAVALGFFLSPREELAPAAPALPSAVAEPREPTAPASAMHPFTLRPDWPVGTRYVYALDWRSEQRVVPPLPGQERGRAQAMEGSLRLAGDLVLRSLGRTEEGFLLGASLEGLRAPELRLSSQRMPEGASLTEALTGREALLEVDGAGNLRALRFRPEDPDLFKHTLQWLLTHVQPTLPQAEAQRSAGRWEVAEDSSHGQAQAVYAVEAEQPLTVGRVRLAYTRLHVAARQGSRAPQRLESQASFTFAPEGHLAGMSHQERLLVQDASGLELLDAKELLRLTLREVSRIEVPADVGLASRTEVRRPGVITTSEGMGRKLLEQRAAGLTMEQLLADLRQYGAGGNMPEKSRWVWRATGLLQLEPERSRELVPLFQTAGLGQEGRALVMDLLASVGHAQGQAVMRELLETGAARADGREYEQLVQRLGLVKAPTAETVDFLARQHEEARAQRQEHLSHASAYALGAAVGKLEDDARAATYHGVLVSGLEGARTEAEREAYLQALGNAGRAESVGQVLSHERASEARVRAAVAAALRKTDSPETTAALLRLVASPERPVQLEALASLREHHLDGESLMVLRNVVVGGGLKRGTEQQLLALLGEHLEAGPAVLQMLQYLAQTVKHDAALRANVLELLGRATGVPPTY